MNRTINRAMLLALVALLAIALLFIGRWWGMQSATRASVATTSGPGSTAPNSDRKVLYWYDPMVPQQHFDAPGKSPFMDMQLVPKYATPADDSTAVNISAAASQRLGMRIAKVERTAARSQIDVSGTTAFDTRAEVVLQAREDGFVASAPRLAAGDHVARGQLLFELTIPAWTAEQQIWLSVQRMRDTALTSAATDRLRLLGMADADIEALRRTGEIRSRFAIRAPSTGVLQRVDVRTGMRVSNGQTLAQINGTNPIWLIASVPEALTARLRRGDTAQAQFQSEAGSDTDTWRSGRITELLPDADSTTRTVQVRIELANADGALRPAMTARVRIKQANAERALTVPTEAIIRTGTRTLVMLAGDNNGFRPTEVRIGHEFGERTEILDGLSEGQRIVASGQYLLDSEATLLGVAPTAITRTGTQSIQPTTPDPPSARAGPAQPASRTEQARAPGIAVPTLHHADGRIDALPPGRVTLTHGPFETLGMPGMTMTFKLASPAVAQGIEAGDAVRVYIREGDDGLVVERIEARSAAQ